jgi:hypothetical protein
VFDDLEALFFENVLPAYREFLRSIRTGAAGHSNDLRLAVNAAAALYHFREHVPSSLRKTRQALAAACPEYDLVGDIANAAKHKHVSRGSPQISSAEDIYELVVVTEYRDEHGPYRHAEKNVMVRLVNGSVRDVEGVLTAAYNMWIRELRAFGLLNGLQQAAPDVRPIPTREASSGAARLDLGIQRGVRFRAQFAFRRYNYGTGIAEPVDLSGYTGEFGVYSLAYTLDVVMRHDETGREIRLSIDLSSEQSLQYAALRTDDERQQFLSRIATDSDSVRSFMTSGPTDESPSEHGLKKGRTYPRTD